MRKVNISLVGGQPMPVYVGIDAVNPDVVVLVHSEQSKRDAEKIAINTENNGGKVELVLFPDLDYPQTEMLAKDLLDQYVRDNVYVNVSGGLKPWAIAFAKTAFAREGVCLFYIDQNNCFVNLNEAEVQDLQLKLDIPTILKYNHQEVSSYTDIEEYDEADIRALDKIYEVKRRRPGDFFGLTGASWRATTNAIETRTLNYGASLVIDRVENQVTFSGTHRDGKSYEFVISSPHVCEMVVNARWFEVSVALVLKKWNSAIQVWTNVMFPYRNGNAKNEIDVLVSDGTKLLFVECKTQIYDVTHIDKFRTACKTYGGTASKALFVIDANVMRPEAQQKCEEHKIMTFCMSGRKDSSLARNLYIILDQERVKTNEK